jgi:hypothetical protein
MLAKAQFTNSHPYLLDERKISSETLTDPRFNNIKIDARRNALFPHYNSSGVSGYEIKNKDFTGFAKGGEKGIWYTSNIMRAKNVVICESAIDALSHAELKIKGRPTRRQVIWNLYSYPLLGRDEVTRTNRGAAAKEFIIYNIFVLSIF